MIAAAGDEFEGQKNRERNARARAAQTKAAQNIGKPPKVVDQPRRDACERDFRLFCETYFPEAFHLAWSDDHLRVIGKVERAVLHGGLFAVAMPRGSGKTTMILAACLWAILYGHVPFVCLVAASSGKAEQLLSNIKTWLETNQKLFDSFPEACHPIRRLDRSAHKAKGQHIDGAYTRIEWGASKIAFPEVDGSHCFGAVISTAGLDSADIRGQQHVTSDGRIIRPGLVVLDDPQTRESARSLTQCATREAILSGDVLGMAGPGQKISGIMPCTVIRKGDMADAMLDRAKHPMWQGERTKMVYEWPCEEGQKHWEEYARIRSDEFRDDSELAEGEAKGAKATAYYAAHREVMDRGARVAWPARHDPDELSAIQNAYNLKILDEPAFCAEYQNEPIEEGEHDEGLLEVDQIAAKINGHQRGEVAVGCEHLTAFIDIQGKLLYWMVCAWTEDFTGYVIDYGAFPDQQRHYYTLRDAKVTLADKFPGMGQEGQINAGLTALTEWLLPRQFERDDGATLKIERCLIDANWGTSNEVVYAFCKASQFSGVLMPAHGRFVGASSTPFNEYKRHKGDRMGHNWHVPSVAGKKIARHVRFDTNYWKTFVHARLFTATGDPGCLSLFIPKINNGHRMIAEQLTAEYRVKTEGRGRSCDEWKLPPNKPDNHWLDCLVGCAVAASMQGCSLASQPAAVARKVEKVSFAERMQKRRRWG